MTTIFSKIIAHELPADIVLENDQLIAFRDIHPLAPVHILIVPKKPLKNLKEVTKTDQALLGDLLLAAQEIAAKLQLTDYRIVMNNGERAGQSVFHLHLHLLGGRSLGALG